jgi:hypothetical protein
LTYLCQLYSFRVPRDFHSSQMTIFLPRFLQITEDVATFLLYLVFAIRYAGSKTFEGTFGAHLRWISEHGFAFGTSLAFYVLVSKVVRYFAGDRSNNRKQIKRILDALQKAFFQDVQSDELFKHRVTLFRACRSYWFLPVGRYKYLRLYARSGTRYQNSATFFCIDGESEGANEGVAGQAWFRDAQVTAPNLSAWPDGDASETNPVCQSYLEGGYLPFDKTKSLQIKSRSISATVVRNKAGERWGVLVLDSRDPNGIQLNSEKRALISLVAEWRQHTKKNRACYA